MRPPIDIPGDEDVARRPRRLRDFRREEVRLLDRAHVDGRMLIEKAPQRGRSGLGRAHDEEVRHRGHRDYQGWLT